MRRGHAQTKNSRQKLKDNPSCREQQDKSQRPTEQTACRQDATRGKHRPKKVTAKTSGKDRTNYTRQFGSFGLPAGPILGVPALACPAQRTIVVAQCNLYTVGLILSKKRPPQPQLLVTETRFF